MKNIILKDDDSYKEFKEYKNIKKEENKNEEKINLNKIKNENNENINKDNNAIKNEKENKVNVKTNFLIDRNNNIKCSCFRTQCDKLYCECVRTKRYCISCNCKNCLNKPPKNFNSDLKITNSNNNIKEKKIFCKCTKSGCKSKYCECVKYDMECNDLCRCIKCKNSRKEKINNFYKVCFVNSIYIINNEIHQNGREIINKKFLNKKRRKKGKKKNDNNKNKKNNLDKNEINLNENLFDKNGNIIFKHIKLSNFGDFLNFNV